MNTSRTSTTSFDNKVKIIAELSKTKNERAKDFGEYANIGVPLAYLYEMGYVEVTEKFTKEIEDTFWEFLADCSIPDTGFTSLAEILPLIVPDPYFDLEPYVEED